MSPRRTEALSDSTFAVAMTLLIFDVRLANHTVHGVSHDLWFSEWYHYLGYVVSFAVVGMIWLSHHSIFRLLQRVDHATMVLNLLLLGMVVFVPFPTQLLAAYLVRVPNAGDVVAVVYGLTLAGATLVLAVLWHHVERHPELLHAGIGRSELHRLTVRLYVTPLLYVVAVGVAAANHWAGLVLYLLIALVYIFHTGTRAFPVLPPEVEATEVASRRRSTA